MRYAVALLAFVTLQRLGELIWGAQNTARLLASGGIEFGRKQYPANVALQTAWLAGLWYWGADYAADTHSHTASNTMRNAACSDTVKCWANSGREPARGGQPAAAGDGGA